MSLIPPSPSMTEPQPIEIDVGREVFAVAFSPDGKFLVSGDSQDVRVWRPRDGMQMASMKTGLVDSVAISQDGIWIAAGTCSKGIFVWNAKTYKLVFKHNDGWKRKTTDFSPDSKRLVEGSQGKAVIWDFRSSKQVKTLRLCTVLTAKYSPQGDRIAVCSSDSILVYDSENAHLLIEIKVEVTQFYNKGLVWFGDHIICVSPRGIQEYDASRCGSLVAEWPVFNSNSYSCIALSHRGTFIAFAAGRTVLFLDTVTDTRLAPIQHSHSIRSTAFSPDNRFLAIGSNDGKLSLQSLPRSIHPIPLSSSHITSQEPATHLNDAVIFPPPRLHPTLQDPDNQIDDLKTKPGRRGERLKWALGFRQRSRKRLESLGDTAVDAQQYNDALSSYSTALPLISSSQKSILIKRCKALLKMGSWKQALDDANQLIALDSSSPWGYELTHAALHCGGDYDNAIKAFETMLSKMTKSGDPDVQQQANKYISPSDTQAAIRKAVQRTLRRLPHVLINTATGRLYNRAEQASAFESLPIFKELISSMTTCIDHIRIKEEVRQYYRYVVLSHKWEDNEPLFQHVVHVAVYDLKASPTHHKLQNFCKIVWDSGFNWAWSDTCCIDKTDHSVLQESLVAMFRWYQDSSMMLVFLRGVPPSSSRGALAGSIWNARAWTLQEYIAAKVVRFYTQDWTLYRDLDVPNHKECPEIIAEMEEVTRISARQLMALRPGLGNIREKLCLASTRETTRVEDAAYSLFGIFSAIGVPVIYGEGEASLGRLIANVITRSGDASGLAWVGDHSAFNSCLPARIAVFNGLATSHLPLPIPDSEMEAIVTRMHTPSFDLDTALKLYDRLNELPIPRFAESRMTLPCIAFELPSFVAYRAGAGRVYRADTIAFGTVDIRTRQDLTRMKPLYLVHPWLDSLLAHEDMHGGAEGDDDVPPSPLTSDNEEICEDDVYDHLSLLPVSLSRRSVEIDIEPVSKETEARRLVARLRQPFGALVLMGVSTGRRRGAMDYKRVATDALVSVQFREDVSLGDILANVRVLDVL